MKYKKRQLQGVILTTIKRCTAAKWSSKNEQCKEKISIIQFVLHNHEILSSKIQVVGVCMILEPNQSWILEKFANVCTFWVALG